MPRPALVLAALLAGCLPALEDQCDDERPCPDGRACLAGVCVAGGGADVATSPDTTTSDPDAAPPDGHVDRDAARPADGGADMAAPLDASADVFAADVAPPRDAALPLDAARDATAFPDAEPDAAPEDCDPGTVRDCRPGVQDCGGFRQVCNLERRFGPCEPVAPEPEICDGVDNDCSGRIDDIEPFSRRLRLGVATARDVAPRVARGSQALAVTWAEREGDDVLLKVAPVGGDLQARNVQIARQPRGAATTAPDISGSGRDFALVWHGGLGETTGAIHRALTPAEGQGVGPFTLLAADARTPRTAALPDGHLLVWEEPMPQRPRICHRRIWSADARTADGCLAALRQLPDRQPAVAGGGGQFGLAWVRGGDQSGGEVTFQIVSSAGTAQGLALPLTGGRDGRQPAVTYAGGPFAVAWVDDGGLVVTRVALPDALRLIRIERPAPPESPTLAWLGGDDLLLAWQEPVNGVARIFAAWIPADGQPRPYEVAVHRQAATLRPHLTAHGGDAVLTWQRLTPNTSEVYFGVGQLVCR